LAWPFPKGTSALHAGFWLYVFILIKIIDYVKKSDHKSLNMHVGSLSF